MLTLGLSLTSAALAQERKVTVVSWGGSFMVAQRDAMWVPYGKETGVKVLEDTWNGEFAKIKAQVDSKNVTWDLIVADYDPSRR